MENNAASSKKPLTKKPNNMTTTLNKTKTMKGIYLTEEGKKDIEAKIAELEKLALDEDRPSFRMGQKIILLEILSSATILPVEESWENVNDLLNIYKNGVIIKPKLKKLKSKK
jgi:hypothetical protein